jgi:hypothetical protein
MKFRGNIWEQEDLSKFEDLEYPIPVKVKTIVKISGNTEEDLILDLANKLGFSVEVKDKPYCGAV